MHTEAASAPFARVLCGAQRRGRPGHVCRNRAGQRTSHEGVGRCWLHGGATPIKHGRYSAVTRLSIQELVAGHPTGSISHTEVTHVVEGLWRVVARHVTAPVMLARIQADWRRTVQRGGFGRCL
jgi:hypothetical protein